jgi:hypothetical protein
MALKSHFNLVASLSRLSFGGFNTSMSDVVQPYRATDDIAHCWSNDSNRAFSGRFWLGALVTFLFSSVVLCLL